MFSVLTGFAIGRRCWCCGWGGGLLAGSGLTARTAHRTAQELWLFVLGNHGGSAFTARSTWGTRGCIRTRQRRVANSKRQISDERGLFDADGFTHRYLGAWLVRTDRFGPDVGLLVGAEFGGCRWAVLRAEFLAELRPAFKPVLTIWTVGPVMIVAAVHARLVVVPERTVAALTVSAALARWAIKAAFARLAVSKLLATTLVAVVAEAVAAWIIEAIVAAVAVIKAFTAALAALAALISVARLVVAALLIVETGLTVFETRVIVRTRVFKARLLIIRARRQIDGRQRLHIAAERLALVLTVFVGIIHRLARSVHAARSTIFTALRLAFAIGEDDPVIMFGVLEIIFSQNGVARRRRIARQR